MDRSNGPEPEQKPKKSPRYVEIEGLRFADCFLPDLVRSAIEYKPDPGDTFVATYPKCGTTWMLEMVMLILKKGQVPTSMLEYFASSPFIDMLGAEGVAASPEDKCIKTHLPFNLAPYSPEAKYIYVARNPRDCCISFYHHTRLFPGYYFTDGSFDDFFDLFVEGHTDYNDYFDHLLSWYEQRHQPNVFFVTYEEVKKDHRGTVQRLVEFLGGKHAEAVSEDDQLLEDIVRKSTLEYMRNTTNGFWQEMVDHSETYAEMSEASRGFRSWAKGNADAIRAGERSVGQFVRCGQVGQKTDLSPEQEERLKMRILEKTAGSDVMRLWDDLE